MNFEQYKEGQYLGIIDEDKVYVFRFVKVCEKPNEDYRKANLKIINIKELKDLK